MVILNKCRGVDGIFEKAHHSKLALIRQELGEENDRLAHAELHLNQWTRCQARVPHNFDRNTLRNFLRGSKHNLERAKRKLDKYFEARFNLPEIYRHQNPESPEIHHVIQNTNIAFLPNLTENGERICIFSLTNNGCDASKFDVEHCCRLVIMICDLLLTAEQPVSGEILVFDGSNATATHYLKMLATPLFKKTIQLLKDAYPVRIKQIHVVQKSSIIEKFLNAIKPLVHEKLRKRFLVHKNLDTLLNCISPEVLPSDYGGNSGMNLREVMNVWHETLQINSDWFKKGAEDADFGPRKKFQEMNRELEGTFRKLEID